MSHKRLERIIHQTKHERGVDHNPALSGPVSQKVSSSEVKEKASLTAEKSGEVNSIVAFVRGNMSDTGKNLSNLGSMGIIRANTDSIG